MTKEELTALENIASQKPWDVTRALKKFLQDVEVREESKSSRTSQQNRALHLWLSMVAEELDKHGHTLQDIVGKIRKAEIRPNTENLKEVMWKPYQMAALRKDSTTKLTKHEVDIVYEGLNKFLGQEFEIHIPFPNDEARQEEETSGYKTAAGQTPKGTEYPEYEEPTI